MKITITADVPDEWADATHHTGILEKPYEDIHDAMLGVGAENISIEADGESEDWVDPDGPAARPVHRGMVRE